MILCGEKLVFRTRYPEARTCTTERTYTRAPAAPHPSYPPLPLLPTSAEPRFQPTDPPPLTEVTHADGCRCVLGPDRLGRLSDYQGEVTCTCPVLPPLNADEDFDTHPYKG